MRFFLGGPRIFGLRTGVSFGRRDLERAFGGGLQARGVPSGAGSLGSFIYVVRGDHNLVKIGVSSNPTARLAQLRTGSPFPISYAFVGAVSEGEFEVEREAHNLLTRQRVEGEWFDVSSEAATAAVMAAASKLGHRIHPVDASSVDEILRLASGSQMIAPRSPRPLDFILRVTQFVIVGLTVAAFGVLIYLFMHPSV